MGIAFYYVKINLVSKKTHTFVQAKAGGKMQSLSLDDREVYQVECGGMQDEQQKCLRKKPNKTCKVTSLGRCITFSEMLLTRVDLGDLWEIVGTSVDRDMLLRKHVKCFTLNTSRLLPGCRSAKKSSCMLSVQPQQCFSLLLDVSLQQVMPDID